jgi:excisionase family DNA binding protein
MVKYYSKQEVMAYLKISLPTLNRYMKQGLKYHKVGRNVRFKMREINAFRKDKMKHYLTYEDLKTLESYKYYTVKLNGNKYELTFQELTIQELILQKQDKELLHICLMQDEHIVMEKIIENYNDIQFFNDLKLELVEE